MRRNQELLCHQCGHQMHSEDTAVIKIAQPRFEKRKHCCPNCGAVIAVEIGPSGETETAVASLDQKFSTTDFL